MDYIASPMSTAKIRSIADIVRELLGYSEDEAIDMPKAFDLLSQRKWKNGRSFQYEICSDDNPIFEEGVEAKTIAQTGVVYVKESVFIDACSHRNSRGAYTLAHELGHFILHYLLGGFSLARSVRTVQPPAYASTEWQANSFAAEFLMPYEACKTMSARAIAKRFNVSFSAAKTRRTIVLQYMQEEGDD